VGSTPSWSVATSPRALAFDANGAPFVGWSRTGIVEAAKLNGSAWTVATVYDGGNTNWHSAPELAVDTTLGVVAGFGGSTDVMAAAYGAGGWKLLPNIVSVTDMVWPGGTTFAAGPGTGLWARGTSEAASRHT
jgi:hypothetical protein